MTIDTWRYFDITHRDHVVCNPSSLETLNALIALLALPANPRILDIGSGKGEFLVRTVERYGGPAGAGASAVAVDPSPYVNAELRSKARARVPDASIEIVEAGGADYDAEPGAFDLGVCLGASWAFAGYRGTLEALARATKPGGLVLVGEPYWIRTPDAAYLKSLGAEADAFGTHAGNVEAGEALGLVPHLAWPSTRREWDIYETLQWRAAARFAAEHPGDPDLPELLERVARGRHEYLTWGRDTLGWALYLFGVPATR
jgi:SAM-dependent methyltransferase